MEFSINFVKDGQSAFISISGLDFAHSHKEEIRDKLNEALSLALGITSPTNSMFNKEDGALSQEHLIPNREQKEYIKEKKEIGKYEQRDGIIKDIDEIEIVGTLGNKTLKADSHNYEMNNNLELLNYEDKKEDNYSYVKKLKEREVIRQIFVLSSTNSNNELFNELKCHYSALKSINK